MAATTTNTEQAIVGTIFTPLADRITASPGVVSGGAADDGLVITTATPSMAVRVTPGIFSIPGPAPTTQGNFLWTWGTGYYTATIGAADATNPRIDLVTAQVVTPGDATTAGTADIIIVPGTPAATPAAPSTPTGAIVLAQVRVNVSDTTVTSARITDVRTFASPRANSTAVTAPTHTAPKVYWGTKTQTTDASGYMTWTHGIGTTPSVIIMEMQSPLGPAAAGHITDTYGATTARTRFLQSGTVVLASTSVTFRWVAFL